MRLLVVNWQDRHNPQAGGAEIHLHEVFGRLAARGHEVTLLASGWGNAPARATSDGIEIHRVGSRHTFSAAAPLYYRKVLRERGFDVLVEDLNKLPVWSPLWAECPVMLLVHHLFGATAFQSAAFPVALTSWLGERPLPYLYRGVPVQAVSRSTGEELEERGFRPHRIRVVHNGVDSAYYQPDAVSRTAEPTLLYLGRLQSYKRIDLIVRALAQMARLGVRARLRIAGRGPDEVPLRTLAARLGVADRVDFLGFVDEEKKLELLRSSWVHVLTSAKEGWGLTVVEAGACGTPTVGSRSPGLRDSVVHGETGLLLPHGDWEELGTQLAALVQDPQRLARMGAAARQRAEAFTWDRSADETEEHLLSCVSSEARRLPTLARPRAYATRLFGAIEEPGLAAMSGARLP
jgi:glycosyltransferase involved in cell wall biosynthesis